MAENHHFKNGGAMKLFYKLAIINLAIIVLPFVIYSQQNCSALFNGTGQIKILDTNPQNPSSNPAAYMITGKAITVEAWVCPIINKSFDTADGSIVHRSIQAMQNDLGTYRLFVTFVGGNPRVAFSIFDSTSSKVVRVIAPYDLPRYQWTHLAGTYDGTLVRIYVNGQLNSETATNISIAQGSLGFFFIGNSWGGNRFNGLIDDVSLWNIARSQTEIQAAMGNELTGTEPGLAGYWNMNELTIQNNVKDATTNQNDLIIKDARIVPMNHSTPFGTPTYTLTPASINFGKIEQNYMTSKNISINNTGTAPIIGYIESPICYLLTISNFYIPVGQSYNLVVNANSSRMGVVTGQIDLHILNAATQQIPFSIEGIAVRRFDGNNISMTTLRDGRFAQPDSGSTGGLEWPKGSGKTAIYESGIWIGANVNGGLRTATAWYWSDFLPGPIMNGVAADPNDTTNRVYKINAGDIAATNPDYASWPSNLGAPVNPDGSPLVLGDQTLFSVYNDLQTGSRYFDTQPLGAEVQQTIFGFNKSDAHSNTVFIRFKIINKSSSTWNSTYFALWADPDLGYYGDDLVGIDTARCMGIVYNGSNTDPIYVTPPPAAGYQLLKGAFYTKPIQAFAYFSINGAPASMLDPTTAEGAYNYLQGKWADGSSYIGPDGRASTFALNGDPVTGTGWKDLSAGDKRFLFSTGPFNLEPGQSREIIAAIILGKGTDYLNSITAIRAEADSIKSMYDRGQIFGGALENVVSATMLPDSTKILNDLMHSGVQLTATGGTGGATIEEASYNGPPPGAQIITNSSIAGVGKYLEVQALETLTWPLKIRMYYTKNDLLQSGISESNLRGIYYWRGATNQWILYSNSGPDDQGRGPSSTSVDTTNIVINGVSYEGCVIADAYHLTPFVLGAKKISEGVDNTLQTPKEFALLRNYPNPFNPSTIIQYSLPARSTVRVVIYNVLGQVVKELVNSEQQAGYQFVVWNANVSSGMYFYRLEAVSTETPSKRFVETKKMLLLK